MPGGRNSLAGAKAVGVVLRTQGKAFPHFFPRPPQETSELAGVSKRALRIAEPIISLPNKYSTFPAPSREALSRATTLRARPARTSARPALHEWTSRRRELPKPRRAA